MGTTIYTTNVIETNQQDGTVKCVLGSIVEGTDAKLSKRITRADAAKLVALGEKYSAPALVEFLGRHVLAVANAGRRTHNSEKAEKFYQVFDKIGIALYASSIAINALAASGEEDIEAPDGEKPSADPTVTEAEFLKKLKELERKLARQDKKGK